MPRIVRLSALLLCWGLVLPAAPAQAREGFGILKAYAPMTRVRAPEIYLPGTQIHVRADPSAPNFKPEAARVARTVETDLLNADPRLSAATDRPDVIIEISVLQSRRDQQTTQKEVQKSRYKGKDENGKAVYEYYDAVVDVHHVEYSFEATYRVDDVRGGRHDSIHADSFRHTFEDSFNEDEAVPTESGLRDDALAAASRYIVQRLAPTAEVFEVVIPKGSFKELTALAENGHWSLYLQRVQTVPPVKKSPNEAYRQYALGLAHEGLGYNAETPEQTLRYLEQALVHYNRAIQMKPDEEYFLEGYDRDEFELPIFGDLGIKTAARHTQAPLDRVRTSMLSYEEIKRFQEEIGGGVLVAGSKDASQGAGGAPATVSEDALSNAKVIEMHKAGLSDDIIINSIANCREHRLDISPDGLIELNRAGVNAKIIRAVQERAHP